VAQLLSYRLFTFKRAKGSATRMRLKGVVFCLYNRQNFKVKLEKSSKNVIIRYEQ